jgi:hypothetical protein
MTIDQAERLTKQYQRVLLEEDKRGGRRNPSRLPAPKERIITALKLELAQLFYFYGNTNDSAFKPLIDSVMFIDSFDDIPQDAAKYIESMQRRRMEMEHFIQELLKIERPHPFYWQCIYSLLGITSETKTTSFFEGIKQKLKFGQSPALASPERPIGRRPTGRVTID